MIRIEKRDGSYQEFKEEKVRRSMLAAFDACGDVPNLKPLVDKAIARVRDGSEGRIVRISDVQDSIEEVLMDSGFHDVARCYIKYRGARDRARAQRLAPNSTALPEYMHVAKYAKWMPEYLRRELRDETVARSREMMVSRWPEYADEISVLYDGVNRREYVGSMRSMQFAGKRTLDHNASVYNCAFTLIDRPRVIQELFYLLLCGTGCGYSVQMQHIEKMPKLGRMDRSRVVHHVVDDSIEGWADAAGALIDAAIAGVWVEFSYHKIRDKGTRLVTSGGRAPGHLGLRKGLEAARAVLLGGQGRRLRAIEWHDIICHLAEAVLSGGIRRSAMLCLFSVNDTEMVYSKAHENFRPAFGTDPGVNSQRQMANNSACLLRGSVSRVDFDRLVTVADDNYGCPGFYWTNNLDYGPNPCGEIGMWPVTGWCSVCNSSVDPRSIGSSCLTDGCPGVIYSRTGWQFCNLSEVNVATCVGALDFISRCQAAAGLGTLQAAWTDFWYLGDGVRGSDASVSEIITKREALIGVSLTGIMDNPAIGLDPQLLQAGAQAVIAANKLWAKRLGINASSRCTTVKPSGKASVWLGPVSSGIHGRWARRYLYRVTASKSEAAYKYFVQHNPHMIEHKNELDACLVFPIEAPSTARTVRDYTALEFVDDVMLVYDNWIVPGTADPASSPGLTHNVSCTVTLRDGDKADVVERIWERQDSVAAMSFVPFLIDKKFPFAPREAVTPDLEARWNNLIENYVPVDWGQFYEDEDGTQLAMAAACVPGGDC
jgi:ATP cone domain